MAKSGLNKALAKSTYTKVNSYISSLDTHLNSLNQHVTAMNKEAWYGGTRAGDWYKAAASRYAADVKFRNALSQLQAQIKIYVDGLNKIDF